MVSPAIPGISVQQGGAKWAKLLILVVAILCLLASAALFAFSLVSFTALRAIVLRSIPPGYADRFTPGLFAKVILGSRVEAVALLLAGVLLIVFSRRLGRTVEWVFASLRALPSALGSVLPQRSDGLLHVAAFVIVVVWAVALRASFLGEPIRKDESYSYLYYASRPVFVGLAYYTANNHLLNTLLMHISTSIFGLSIWSLRLPTFLAGCTLVPLTYMALRAWCDRSAALMAAGLAAASSPLIEYSFNARGYSLGACFLLAMLILAGLGIKQKTSGAWVLFPFTAALAMYSVPTMLYGVGGMFLYLFLGALFIWHSRDLLRTLVAVAFCGALFTLVLYAPVLGTVGLRAITSNQWTLPLPPGEWGPHFVHESAALWRYWNMDVPLLITGLLVALALYAVVGSRETLRLPPWSVLLCIVAVACALMAFQHVVPPRRTWLFLLPLWLSCVAVGWGLLMRRLPHPQVIAAAATVIVSFWMGATVLANKSLRAYREESIGGGSTEALVLAMKNRLLAGAQFINTDGFDGPLDFEMLLHGIRYRPSPTGELLIVTREGGSPTRALQLGQIPQTEVAGIHELGRYGDLDVYEAQRAPGLPFEPKGDYNIGVFTGGAR